MGKVTRKPVASIVLELIVCNPTNYAEAFYV